MLGWLVWDYYSGNLTANPLQAATQRTGKYALILLVSSLACTPLNILFGWKTALNLRRMLGLYAFMFAVMHMLIFVGLDYGFPVAGPGLQALYLGGADYADYSYPVSCYFVSMVDEAAG